MSTSANNGFRFATLAIGESLMSPSVCDCCEREDLKKTVKLINPEGRVVWYGTGCAAKAMGLTKPAVRKAKKAAEDAADAAEKAAKQAEWRREEAAWQAFLDAAVGSGDRFDQIQKLGGMKAARAMFQATKAA